MGEAVKISQNSKVGYLQCPWGLGLDLLHLHLLHWLHCCCHWGLALVQVRVLLLVLPLLPTQCWTWPGLMQSKRKWLVQLLLGYLSV